MRIQHMDLAKQHQVNEGGADGEDGNGPAVKSAFPEELRRRYEVFLTLPSGEKLLPMRGVTSTHLGSLVKVKVCSVPPRFRHAATAQCNQTC